MTYQNILLDIADDVGRITLNRPDKLNSFTAEMHAELQDAQARTFDFNPRMFSIGATIGF